MNKALVKQSIDDWNNLLVSARETLIPRSHAPSLPTQDIALALIGIRRCGKTHLAFQISKELPSDNVFYYNFEDPLFYANNKVEHLDLLISVAQEFRSAKIKLLILDEIQVVDGWERWLRKLIDQKQYQIIITGSSAKLLSSELASSLTGRALEHKVWPLSFSEIISFKNIRPNSLNDHLSLLREVMQWGGLPEVVKLPAEQKNKLLSQYLNDITLKDVISRNKVRNKRALDQCITYYLTNISSLHSYNSISKAFGFDTVTASEYTMMLQDAFLIKEIPRYHNNLKIQSRDPRKVYTIDTGFRTVGARSVSDDTGKLLENIVLIELLRRNKQVYYFKEVQEVDFILVDRYKATDAIQVCDSNLLEEKLWKREIKALNEALTALNLNQGLIISKDREENISIEDKLIRIIPAHKWLQKES